MKRIILLAVVLCLAAAPVHALTEDIYGTWRLSGNVDAEVFYMNGNRYFYDADFSVDVQVGQIPFEEVSNYDTEETTYRPLDSVENIRSFVNDSVMGIPPNGTINYVYLPEEYSDLNIPIDYQADDIYLPGFGNSDVKVWNNDWFMGVSVHVDRYLYDGAIDIYHFSMNKIPNITGGYDFDIVFHEGADSWSDSILYTSANADGQIMKISSEYLSPNPPAPVVVAPAPTIPAPAPQPEPEPEDSGPVFTLPVNNDDGR